MTILFSFLLLSYVTAQSINSEGKYIFFSSEVGRDVEVYIFDGFKLSLINRVGEFIKEKVPVTKGNYFVLFFLKDGYIPEIKVLKAKNGNINLGEIRLGKKMDDNMGILTGVVYKPVYGGKVSLRKGIFKLIDNFKIKLVSDNGESYLIKSENNGVFSIPLLAGKYKILTDNDQKVFDVLIKEGKTTIKNIQKGLRLLD